MFKNFTTSTRWFTSTNTESREIIFSLKLFFLSFGRNTNNQIKMLCGKRWTIKKKCWLGTACIKRQIIPTCEYGRNRTMNKRGCANFRARWAILSAGKKKRGTGEYCRTRLRFSVARHVQHIINAWNAFGS